MFIFEIWFVYRALRTPYTTFKAQAKDEVLNVTSTSFVQVLRMAGGTGRRAQGRALPVVVPYHVTGGDTSHSEMFVSPSIPVNAPPLDSTLFLHPLPHHLAFVKSHTLRSQLIVIFLITYLKSQFYLRRLVNNRTQPLASSKLDDCRCCLLWLFTFCRWLYVTRSFAAYHNGNDTPSTTTSTNTTDPTSRRKVRFYSTLPNPQERTPFETVEPTRRSNSSTASNQV